MAPQTEAMKHVAAVQAAAPELQRVDWKKSPSMRKLYFYAGVLCVASATTGYDGYVEKQDSMQNPQRLTGFAVPC